jgi:hypothetical protein
MATPPPKVVVGSAEAVPVGSAEAVEPVAVALAEASSRPTVFRNNSEKGGSYESPFFVVRSQPVLPSVSFLLRLMRQN